MNSMFFPRSRLTSALLAPPLTPSSFWVADPDRVVSRAAFTAPNRPFLPDIDPLPADLRRDSVQINRPATPAIAAPARDDIAPVDQVPEGFQFYHEMHIFVRLLLTECTEMCILIMCRGGGMVPPRTGGKRDEIERRSPSPNHYLGGSDHQHDPPLVIRRPAR